MSDRIAWLPARVRLLPNDTGPWIVGVCKDMPLGAVIFQRFAARAKGKTRC